MPKRTIIDARTRQRTVEDYTLSAQEIAESQAYASLKAQEDSRRATLISAAADLTPLPNPYSQLDLNTKFESLLEYIRNKHPEDMP